MLATKIREAQDRLRAEMEAKEKKIKALIAAACQAKIEDFNKNARLFGKEETKKTEGKDLPYHIFADDTYHPMPHTVEATTKTLYKSLAKFIRMIDYMFVQLKINIIKNSFENVPIFVFHHPK